MTSTLHWHAFEYTGRGILSDGEIRKGTAPPNFPPLMVQDWLTRRTHDGRVSHTQMFAEDQADDAAAWLEKELTRFPPLDADSFPIASRIGYARDRLRQQVNRDVVWGYWSQGKRYVARALVSCPGQGPACR